jgi:hypothetical protein
VESCTALVEHRDGRLEIIEWAANQQLSMLTPKALAGPARSPMVKSPTVKSPVASA